MGEGLEHKLKKEAVHSNSLDGLVSSVVSRRYTAAAVRRILVYILLGIGSGTVPSGCYGRVLASGPGGRELIRRMKKDEMSEIPGDNEREQGSAPFSGDHRNARI